MLKTARLNVRNTFQKVLDHDDLWDSDLETDTSNHEITCTAGVWTVIGRYKVPPQQAIRFGYGPAGMAYNQGYLYIALYDDTATNSVLEEGKVRLVQRDYDQVLTILVGEWHTRQLRGDVNDIAKKIALPEQVQFPMVGEDSYLELQFKAAATDDITATAIGTAAGADIWQIPVTVYLLG